MRVGIVLQARMSSSRLPGKVARPLCGRPMLAWIVERLRQCRRADDVIVATSEGADDDAVAELAATAGAAVFRGSLTDVLDRYHGCARQFGLDAVVRATGDNPFVDAEEADRLIEFFLAGGLDYACAFPAFGSLLPVGIGVEIMGRDALERSWREGHAPHHREHVNEYIQENPALFRQDVPPTPAAKQAPELSFTVDTPEQFAAAEQLLAAFLAAHPGERITTEWLVAGGRSAR